MGVRYVCPEDVKKMLLKQARPAYWRGLCAQETSKRMLVQRALSVYWKKWAAKHEYEESKEGLWLEPALALLRKKAKEEWTEKHRNVAGKLVLEGRWVQNRLFDIGWSDES